MATIESLIERGVWQIDQSPFAEITNDKLLLDQHYYSEKPPLLQALSTIPYGLMHYGLNASFNVNPCTDHEICAYKWLTFIMIGLPSAIMIVLLYSWYQRQVQSISWALAMVVLFAFGTMIWPYSLVFNNHIPAAASLLGGFLIIQTDQKSPPKRPARLFLAGLLAALAISFDLITIFIGLALFAWVIIEQRKATISFVLGGAIPVLLTMLFNYQISGSILPPYFATEGYDYPGSPWGQSVAAMVPADNIWLYSMRSLIGDHGFISHAPLLIWPLMGLVVVISHKHHPYRREAIYLAVGMILYTLVILTRTDNFGGRAYGARFFIPLLPLLFLFMPFTLPLNFNTLRGKLLTLLGLVVILLSVVSAYQGTVNTWERVRPLLFLQTRSYPPYLTLCSNLQGNLCLDSVLDPCASANVGYVEKYFEPPSTMQRTLQANFSNQMILLGYDLVQRHVRPGEALPLVLYWQSIQPMEYNYIQFNHLLDEQMEQWGGYDRIPRQTYLTSCWESNQVVVDGYTLPVDVDAPHGIYYLHTGLYHLHDDEPTYLQLVEADHLLEDSSVSLGPILVGELPADIVVTNSYPQNQLDIILGGVIDLKGYDLRSLEDQLQLTLYWQSLAQTEVDYTVFVHVLNEAGQIVAQLDRPPADGLYPTSLWQPDEVIVDRIHFSLPQPESRETYTIMVGMYDAVTTHRLAIDDIAQDAIQLTTFTTKFP